MITNKVKNFNDWIREGKIKNIKNVKRTTSTSISLTNRVATSQGIFTNSKTLKGFDKLYDVYKDLGPLGVLEMLDSVWKNTTNTPESLRHFGNHLLAISVYFDFDQSWINQYSMCISPFWTWFNDIAKNVKRPARNIDIVEMNYHYFRLYLVSLLDM